VLTTANFLQYLQRAGWKKSTAAAVFPDRGLQGGRLSPHAAFFRASGRGNNAMGAGSSFESSPGVDSKVSFL
jgi:hypothetical protein